MLAHLNNRPIVLQTQVSIMLTTFHARHHLRTYLGKLTPARTFSSLYVSTATLSANHTPRHPRHHCTQLGQIFLNHGCGIVARRISTSRLRWILKAGSSLRLRHSLRLARSHPRRPRPHRKGEHRQQKHEQQHQPHLSEKSLYTTRKREPDVRVDRLIDHSRHFCHGFDAHDRPIAHCHSPAECSVDRIL